MAAEFHVSGLDFRVADHLAALSNYLLNLSNLKEPFPIDALDNGDARVRINNSHPFSGQKIAELMMQEQHILLSTQLQFRLVESVKRRPRLGLGRGRAGKVKTVEERSRLSEKARVPVNAVFATSKGNAGRETDQLDLKAGTPPQKTALPPRAAHSKEHAFFHSPQYFPPPQQATSMLKASSVSSDYCIIVKGLPTRAEPQKILEIIMEASLTPSARLLDVQKTSADFVTAKIDLLDRKPLSTMWKNRHKKTFLDYDGHFLTFDLDCAEKYEDSRFSVRNIPRSTDKESLVKHLKAQSVLEEISNIEVLFCENTTNAVVCLDDSIADQKLIDHLNSTGANFEGNERESLRFSLVSACRSLSITGLKKSMAINKGKIRNYLFGLPTIPPVPLVQDITLTEGGHNSIRVDVVFRTVADMQSVRSLEKLPPLLGTCPVLLPVSDCWSISKSSKQFSSCHDSNDESSETFFDAVETLDSPTVEKLLQVDDNQTIALLKRYFCGNISAIEKNLSEFRAQIVLKGNVSQPSILLIATSAGLNFLIEQVQELLAKIKVDGLAQKDSECSRKKEYCSLMIGMTSKESTSSQTIAVVELDSLVDVEDENSFLEGRDVTFGKGALDRLVKAVVKNKQADVGLMTSLRSLAIDLLKRRETFDTFIELFAAAYGNLDKTEERLPDVVLDMTEKDVLIALLESVPSRSEPFVMSCLFAIGYPLPLSYVLHTPQMRTYKINFESMSSVLPGSNSPLILSCGTRAAARIGKSFLLQKIIAKLSSSINTELFDSRRGLTHDSSIDLMLNRDDDDGFTYADAHGWESTAEFSNLLSSLSSVGYLILVHVAKFDLGKADDSASSFRFLLDRQLRLANLKEATLLVLVRDTEPEDKAVLQLEQTLQRCYKCRKLIAVGVRNLHDMKGGRLDHAVLSVMAKVTKLINSLEEKERRKRETVRLPPAKILHDVYKKMEKSLSVSN